MRALKLFTKYAPNKTFLAITLGSLSGLFYAFLIPIVMQALSDPSPGFAVEDPQVLVLGVEVAHSKYALLFVSFVVLILLFKSLSEIVLARVALDIRFELRQDLYNQIKRSPIAALENVGSPRLIQALATDVTAIVTGAQLFPELLTNAVTLIGMLSYLAYLDTQLFIYVLEVILFGIIAFQVPVIFGARKFGRARDHQDILQEAFRGLVEGAKELKLSQEKQQVYENEVLHAQEHRIKGLEKQGQTYFSLAHNFGSLISFFAIGGLSFILVNYHAISNAELIAIVMVLLYITGPIGMLLNILPQLSRTRISLQKLDQLYAELPKEPIEQTQAKARQWQVLKMKQVKYTHLPKLTQAAKDSGAEIRTFGIGPVDLTIKRGEITFIAGGNGSGKSTLSKVISQHYIANEGEIYFGDTLIDKDNMAAYREEISCIYSDYYLFERILGLNALKDDYLEQVNHYIEAFGLTGKVEIQDGHFTTLKLSDGQRRRLALVVAIVEDKSLYVFDEWAADQDPQFKHVFYREILPFFKANNKAVVVISHDDRYFDVADQLLIMESGQLVKTERSPKSRLFDSDSKTIALEAEPS